MDRTDWSDENARADAYRQMERRCGVLRPDGEGHPCCRAPGHDGPHDFYSKAPREAGQRGQEPPRETLLAGLHAIIRRAPAVEPAYDDWAGDTERAERWGQEQGLYEAARIARRTLAGDPPTSQD